VESKLHHRCSQKNAQHTTTAGPKAPIFLQHPFYDVSAPDSTKENTSRRIIYPILHIQLLKPRSKKLSQKKKKGQALPVAPQSTRVSPLVTPCQPAHQAHFPSPATSLKQVVAIVNQTGLATPISRIPSRRTAAIR